MTEPDMPDDLHAEAVSLVRVLCEVSGDPEQVAGELEALSTRMGFEAALLLATAALLVTFGECITQPTPLDAGPVLVPVP